LDVVIVTLLRKTLVDTLKSVKAVIPDPNIILITGKGVMGDLRNKGLLQCSSELTCFVDDDIILNRNWYSKCMRVLQTHPEITAVCGKAPQHYTLGCMIVRTKEFKSAGGFPKLDDHVQWKLGIKMLTLKDAVCEHQIKRGYGPFLHNLHFLCHGFQTEKRAGWWHDPRTNFFLVYDFFKLGYPDFAVGTSLWFVKTFFALPFILEDRRDRKKTKVKVSCDENELLDEQLPFLI
jgi:hypothetical protein